MRAETLEIAIVVANTVTLVAGGFVTFLAVRAYRRTEHRPLRALAVGLGYIVLGTLLGGGVHQSGLASLLVGVTIQSVFTAVGFLFLGWSLLHRASARDEESVARVG